MVLGRRMDLLHIDTVRTPFTVPPDPGDPPPSGTGSVAPGIATEDLTGVISTESGVSIATEDQRVQ